MLMDLTLSALEREARQSWETIVACLRGCAVVIAIGEWERFVLTTTHCRPVVRPVDIEASSTLTADPVALDAIARGTASVVDLVTEGHASMRGPHEELARLSELPSAVLEGIMRSPAAQELWEQFLRRRTAQGPVNSGDRVPVNSSA
jgi:hypothetical protein